MRQTMMHPALFHQARSLAVFADAALNLQLPARSSSEGGGWSPGGVSVAVGDSPSPRRDPERPCHPWAQSRDAAPERCDAACCGSVVVCERASEPGSRMIFARVKTSSALKTPKAMQTWIL
ncbi:hypothetical protein FZEAL_9966 [Fusarium zealandicum]|uniref:Uncharacterized protein n=1 Tax=Fusarium zealandicum TaxID=1053134 RepID=A0A8H4XE25_9HYPO|nr:hypothetical protein FZEAL_9966 [Fusarium zealandicum]